MKRLYNAICERIEVRSYRLYTDAKAAQAHQPEPEESAAFTDNERDTGYEPHELNVHIRREPLYTEDLRRIGFTGGGTR